MAKDLGHPGVSMDEVFPPLRQGQIRRMDGARSDDIVSALSYPILTARDKCAVRMGHPKIVGSHKATRYTRLPPAAWMVWPLSQPESVEARKATAVATSWGCPMRPSGVSCSICFWKSLPMKPAAWTPSVSIMPGLMELTRI